jgi:hypothetical protein
MLTKQEWDRPPDSRGLLMPVSPAARLAAVRDRVAARRGRNIGTVAAARELVEMVFYALRDHHVRRLTRRLPAPALAA